MLQLKTSDKARLAAYLHVLDAHVKSIGEPVYVKYLDLGTHVVELICYSYGFIPHVERNLPYILRDSAPRSPDATLVVWQEANVDDLAGVLEPKLSPKSPYARVHKLVKGAYRPLVQIFDVNISRWHPLIHINPWHRSVAAWDPASNKHYYAVESLDAETFSKMGHLFAQPISKIVRTPTSALVHGAVVGLNRKGVLLCARGGRGKSTLAVQALLDGFDFVSDDYTLLSKDINGLNAWPIYSVVHLSPMMYSDMYDILKVKFVSNNSLKNKYVFNIEQYHHKFVKNYPVQLCMFVQITSNDEPSIVSCTQRTMGRAVTQMAHSTILQTDDKHDIATVQKLVSFVKDLPFYQINLCRDSSKNIRCLKDFIHNGICGQQKNTGRALHSQSMASAPFMTHSTD